MIELSGLQEKEGTLQNNTTLSALAIAQSQVHYHHWAIGEMWRSLAMLQNAELTVERQTSFGTMQATLTHMYMADRVWLNRLSGNVNTQIAGIAVPTPSLLRETWNATLGELCSWTASLENDSLLGIVQYANSTGSVFTRPIWQVLLHVVNHGTGHRGEVNAMMRQAGGQPFNTDLIQFHRTRS